MDKCIQITNTDKKKWIISDNDLRTSLCLYQPSSFKGRTLKLALPLFKPFIIRFPSAFNKIGISFIEYHLDKPLEENLDRLFNCNTTNCYSVFLGTPGIHKKATIQVHSGMKILGYCKVSNSNEVFHLFKKEQEMLEYLNDLGINNIPKCLACKHINNDTFIFAQSTSKTPKSTVHHKFGKIEYTFLYMLYKKTAVTISYKRTDYYSSIMQLLYNVSVLSLNGYDIQCVKDGIALLNNYYDSITTYAVCHRDFTPWNMFIESGQLFVFDFEYSKYYYPVFLDAIHFFFQTSIFEKKWDADKLWKEYHKNKIKDLFDDPLIALLSYLIDIISLYVNREHGEFEGDIRHCMDIWMSLCERTMNVLAK